MKRLSVYLMATFLLAFVWVAGCSNPVANPSKEESTYLSGTLLTQANISGSNPVITIGDSPYVVEGDLVVEEGVTLTIERGVRLMFKDSLSLPWVKIEGKLIAEGEANDPIIFTTARRNPDYGQWRGLIFLNETEQSVIRYCIFEYGAYFELDTASERGREAQNYKGMLAALNSSPIIENNIIFYNQNNGIYVTGANSQPTVRYNIIFKNDASAIRADSTCHGIFIPEFNCCTENSSLDFLLFDSRFGREDTVNENLDSTDLWFNFTLSPGFVDWENGDFALESCSPCIDAGPPDVPGTGIDQGRIDFGVHPYIKSAAELRGIQTGTLSADTPYRMSCHVRIPPGETLTIPAGTIINVSGYYNFEVFGTLFIEGTATNRVYVQSASEIPAKGDWGDLIFIYDSQQMEPSRVSYATFEYLDNIEVYQPGTAFTGCAFRQSFTSGMLVATSSDDGSAPVTIDHCQFDDLGLYGLNLISSTIVSNTLIENCIGNGVIMTGQPSVEDETSRLHNNVIRNCGGNGIVCETFISPQIINNVITGMEYVGIQCYNNSGPLVLNNIIIDCGRPGIAAADNSFPIVNYNNVWQTNTLGASSLMYQFPEEYFLNGFSLESNDSLQADPLFVSGSLYVLGDESPCIDTGHPDSEYNDTDGTRNDMGAYGGPEGGNVGPSMGGSLAVKPVYH